MTFAEVLIVWAAGSLVLGIVKAAEGYTREARGRRRCRRARRRRDRLNRLVLEDLQGRVDLTRAGER